MFKNKLLIPIIHFFIGLTLTTSETYMITRSRNGQIKRTDLSKNYHEKNWNSNSIVTPKIILRSKWLLGEPQELPDELNLPIRHVMVASTGSDICTTELECTYLMRRLQNFDSENLIPYNFLVGGDGNIYEGRGWEYKGAHPKNGWKFDDTISVAYLGTVRKEPTAKQIQATQMLLKKAVDAGKLVPNYLIHAIFDNMNMNSLLPEAVTLMCSKDNSMQSGCSQLNSSGNNGES